MGVALVGKRAKKVKPAEESQRSNATIQVSPSEVAPAGSTLVPSIQTAAVALPAKSTLLAPTAAVKADSLQGTGATPSKWECGLCGEVNKAHRERCNTCGGPSPWITVKSP